MISEIVKVPVAVSETGYILIVGDATGSPSGPNAPQSSGGTTWRCRTIR